MSPRGTWGIPGVARGAALTSVRVRPQRLLATPTQLAELKELARALSITLHHPHALTRAQANRLLKQMGEGA